MAGGKAKGRPTRRVTASDQVVRCRCTSTERRKWVAAASARGLTLSEFLREAAALHANRGAK
jgi:uncharacterized protein (DUF1778 family)